MTSRHIWLNVWPSQVLKYALYGAGAIMALFVWMVPAHAADLTFTKFSSDIVIQNDASIDVTETIVADFSTPHHGIFRNIPFRFSTLDGGQASIPISITGVSQDGHDAQYSTSITDPEVTVKIGDPNLTITGTHTYIIAYTAQAATNFFADHDELYWNVTGNNWDAPVSNISATVHFDSSVRNANNTQPNITQVVCYTGSVGSTEKNCTSTSDKSSATFSSQDFLTIVVGWPTGFITKPVNYDQLRGQAGQTTLEIFFRQPFVFWGLNIGWPLLVLCLLVWHWLRHGRDPRGRGTVIAQYEPPTGMTPGEMGTLIDERASHRDVVATLVDVAVRGYLTITEIKTKKMIGTSTDYQLDQLTPKKSIALKPHEQQLLDGLFSDRSRVTLSDLKGTFAVDVKRVEDSLYDQVRDQGYFHQNPKTTRLMYVVVGIAVAGLSTMLVGLAIIGPVVAGLFVAAAAPFMPQRTAKGAEAVWQAKGFKLFLSKAEKYRLQWQEKENIFETYLPYAMVFGVADKWTKAFAGLQQRPPDWYHGNGGAFNTIVFWSALNNFSTASVRSFAPPAASGSSGFGGGGFSGGGGGGGGGGGW